MNRATGPSRMFISVQINQQDLHRLGADLSAAMREESLRAVRDMSRWAAARLKERDLEQDHEVLGPLWTTAGPVETSGGAVTGETLSRAEDRTFYNKTSTPDTGRVTSTKYPVEGAMLLRILEGGAAAHRIAPLTGHGGGPLRSSVLTIPLPGSEARTKAWLRTFGPGSFLPPAAGDTRFAEVVSHPGVKANHNVRDVGAELERGLDVWAASIAERVAVRMGLG